MIAILLANGFEEIEALMPLDVLRRARLDARTVSITDEKMVTGSHGISVIADFAQNEVDLTKIDYAIFPGGLPGAEYLDKSLFTDKVIEAVKENGGGFIIAGSNYGQGSSREHAALVPLYLGIKGVIAKSFARIHMANLINSGILPMTFTNEEDYDKIDMYDELKIENAVKSVMECDELIVKNITKGQEYKVNIALSDRQREMMALGGLLNYTRETSN